MGRFDFTSPGAAMGDAFTREMIQRAALQRQAILDELQRKETEAQIARGVEQTALAKAAEERQVKADAAANTHREFERAATIADMAGANERADPETAALFTRTGLGGRLDEREAQLPSKTLPMPLLAPSTSAPVSPKAPTTAATQSAGQEGGVFIRPGFKYEQAREAASEREHLEKVRQLEAARLAAEKAGDKAEEAKKDRELRAYLGQLAASTQLAVAGMRGDAKKEAADEKKKEADENAQLTRNTVRAAIQQVRSHPSLPHAVGPIAGRLPSFLPGATDFDSKKGQLTGLLSVNARSKLKGQGTVSDFEGKMLAQSETALNQATDEASFKAELDKLELALDFMEDARPEPEKRVDPKYEKVTGVKAKSGEKPKARILSVTPKGQ